MVPDIRALPPLMRLKTESWKLVQVDHVDASHERKVQGSGAAESQKVAEIKLGLEGPDRLLSIAVTESSDVISSSAGTT